MVKTIYVANPDRWNRAQELAKAQDMSMSALIDKALACYMWHEGYKVTKIRHIDDQP